MYLNNAPAGAGITRQGDKMEITKLLNAMPEKEASDLHIGANTPMHYRINGMLVDATDHPLTPDETRKNVYAIMTEEQINRFEKERELDFSYSIENIARFRVNVFMQRSNVGCAIRMIPEYVRTIAECGLPEDIVKDFCKFPKGMVLVTGATGSGKSTTLAAMVEEINKTRGCHIITVEDPIEYVHKNKKSIIDQREIHHDTYSFNNALRHVLRQDPDVILIGELRDLESIQHALVIADTGHLVLATLHTSDSIQTINRIIDVFPSHQQKQVRIQLSFVLLGVISQQLIPTVGEDAQVLATEILVATPPIKNMIRDERVHQIYSSLQTSQKMGMKTMNQSLAELYNSGVINYEAAISRSTDVEELVKLIGYPR